jgi:hypothetical protein
MEALGQHDPSEWCLFINSSRLSLNAVLLHNRNEYISVPVACAVHMEESYDSMHHLVKDIQNDEYLGGCVEASK